MCLNNNLNVYEMDIMIMKKVLVTGGMGFIGNHLVNHLLNIDCEVIVIDKSINKPIYHPVRQARIIEGDVASCEFLHDCLAEVDTCFHLAALASIPLCNRDWIFSHQNNVLAFNGLLDAIRKLDKPIQLVYASSSAVYGDSDQLPLTESSPASPISTYGADKLSNEIYAKALLHLADIHSIGLRFFNVYGPGQLASNPYTGVISSFKTAILEDKALNIYGDGQQTRDFIYVQDVVDALILCAQKSNAISGIFNVCTGKAVTIESLAKLMMQLMDHSQGINKQPERAGDLRFSVGNPELARKQLGFVAKVPMETGLKSFLQDPFQA